MTVTGVDDAVDDGDIAYTVIVEAATSTDANYNGLDPADVSVTNTDNDTAGVTVSAISGDTAEAGGTATFTVVLNSQPTAPVTIDLTTAIRPRARSDRPRLTFTAPTGTWPRP